MLIMISDKLQKKSLKIWQIRGGSIIRYIYIIIFNKMAKLPLNSEANAIRNITFSENKEKDHEIKQEMISILKEKTDYKKDEESSKAKRERREKIRDLAWDDPEKIGKLKEVPKRIYRKSTKTRKRKF